MKQRAFKVAKIIGIPLFIGLIYVGVIYSFDIGIPCPIKKLTGFSCPGCGVSRMCLALLDLDFEKAFVANPVLFVILPILICLAIASIIRYIKYDTNKITKMETNIIILLIIILLAFGVIRNLPFYH